MYIIYGKDNCPYCDHAKKLLDSKQKVYEFKMLGIDYGKDELIALVPDARTVPQIFKDGELIGGFDKLKESFN